MRSRSVASCRRASRARTREAISSRPITLTDFAPSSVSVATPFFTTTSALGAPVMTSLPGGYPERRAVLLVELGDEAGLPGEVLLHRLAIAGMAIVNEEQV